MKTTTRQTASLVVLPLAGVALWAVLAAGTLASFERLARTNHAPAVQPEAHAESPAQLAGR